MSKLQSSTMGAIGVKCIVKAIKEIDKRELSTMYCLHKFQTLNEDRVP